MRYLLLFIVSFSLITISSCRKNFSTTPSFGKLEFSKDTVFLDTVFTNIGSATYNLKVYNRSSKDISIPSIQLENGMMSNYRLNVDGIAGKEFNEINILANDSMYVFVETTIDFSTITDPLYTDKILFDNGINQQDVDLVTLVQDANFIFPGRDPLTMEIDKLTFDGEPTSIQGRFLEDSELVFSNTKPTVIYGYAAVPSDKTLIVEAGAKIHFHDNSGLIIDDNASLKVNGTMSEKVVFEGDRLENSFSNVPGQWGVILIRPGSVDNTIQHAVIKNGLVGLLVGNALGSDKNTKLTLENTEIYNHGAYGIWARDSEITGYNLVMGNAGFASLAATIGGEYNFTHSTFANYWNRGIRQLPAVLVNNYQDNEEESGQVTRVINDLIAANFTNCIFDGNSNIEFVLDKVEGSVFDYSVSNSMLRFNDVNGAFANNIELDFTNPNYQNNILNGFLHFRNPQKNDFVIGQDSDAINKAISTLFSMDILGVDRSISPDIGAYQHVIFE
ncbi:MAG: hypothetical protein P8P28_07195 [Polaribacter sp.]|nr:hypothetical protein [Polaribacter sp.]MDG1321799.1 hypothetical protein [Polaribacter sp.]